MKAVVHSLFHELLDLPPEARAKVFADRRIDPDVRAEVESLLGFDSNDQHSLTAGIRSLAEDIVQSSQSSNSNDEPLSWGPYRRVSLLGAGGMGTVYLAERMDGEVQQRVAVKLLRSDVERPV